MHHFLLVLPQILHNTGFSKLLHVTFVSCFHYQTLLLLAALLSSHSQVPIAVTYCVHLEEPNVMCAISPTLHINFLQRLRSYICTEAGSLQGTHNPVSNNGQ